MGSQGELALTANVSAQFVQITVQFAFSGPPVLVLGSKPPPPLPVFGAEVQLSVLDPGLNQISVELQLLCHCFCVGCS